MRDLSLGQIALIIFLVLAGLIYLGVAFTYLSLLAGIAALLAALFTAVGK